MQNDLSLHLIECLKMNDFTFSFYNIIQSEPCWECFIGIFENDTLTTKLEKAIKFRDCGNFNKAMLYVSEINRDHVTYLRNIQHGIDILNGRPKTEVILRSFRQFIPLEVGMENAPDMLSIIEKIINPWREDNLTNLQIYHGFLRQIEEYKTEIDINSRFNADESEIEKLRQKLDITNQDFNELQKLLATRVLSLVVSTCLKYTEPAAYSAEEMQQLFLSILVPITTVCFSPIITRPASDVQVDR